jgi:hypothetical protein
MPRALGLFRDDEGGREGLDLSGWGGRGSGLEKSRRGKVWTKTVEAGG